MGDKNPNLAHLKLNNKNYVCGSCLRTGTPFIMGVKEDNAMRLFEEHLASHSKDSHGKADK